MKDLKYGNVTVEGGTQPDDEPCFLLRGQDLVAIHALTAYRRACVDVGCTNGFIAAIDDALGHMAAWSPKKIPD